MSVLARRPVVRRSRLVARIYLVSLLAILVIFAALVGLRKYVLEPPWLGNLERQAAYFTHTLTARRDRPAAMEREAQRIRRELNAAITVYRSDGTLLVTTVQPPLPPLSPAALARLERRRTEAGGSPLTATAAVTEDGRLVAYGMLRPPRVAWPWSDWAATIAIVLACVGVASLLAARALARPLQRLAGAAQALGAGQLDARVGLQRRDELGEVARAFDDMADRVAHLLRTQQELLANVSHELRTPLSRIRVALDIASEGDAARARESLDEIAEDLAELERLVDDILTAARFDLTGARAGAPAPSLRREPIDTRAFLEKVAARFRSTHASRPLALEVPEELPTVAADAALLRRVIDNLLDNAHKYSEPTAPVTLRAFGTDGTLVVEVVDRGIGIDAQDLPHVFEPFFRADRSRTRATGGVGLGLALARRIVEAHGGTIAIESSVGAGTTVRLTIPAAETPAAA